MTFHDLLGDVETESQAAVIRRGDLAAAMETLEPLSELVGGDSDSAVINRSDDHIAPCLDRDAYVASIRRVLHGVFQQVAENLLQPVAIAFDPAIFRSV